MVAVLTDNANGVPAPAPTPIPIPVPSKRALLHRRSRASCGISPGSSSSLSSAWSPLSKSQPTTHISSSQHVPGVTVNHARPSPPPSRESSSQGSAQPQQWLQQQQQDLTTDTSLADPVFPQTPSDRNTDGHPHTHIAYPARPRGLTHCPSSGSAEGHALIPTTAATAAFSRHTSTALAADPGSATESCASKPTGVPEQNMNGDDAPEPKSSCSKARSEKSYSSSTTPPAVPTQPTGRPESTQEPTGTGITPETLPIGLFPSNPPDLKHVKAAQGAVHGPMFPPVSQEPNLTADPGKSALSSTKLTAAALAHHDAPAAAAAAAVARQREKSSLYITAHHAANKDKNKDKVKEKDKDKERDKDKEKDKDKGSDVKSSAYTSGPAALYDMLGRLSRRASSVTNSASISTSSKAGQTTAMGKSTQPTSSAAGGHSSTSAPLGAGAGAETGTVASRSGVAPRAPSSATTSKSQLKKYGVCEKVAIGRGATAVVRLAHNKFDRTHPSKLYAVKEFRKRRKNESEKEYVKKVTSEFCISSTLHHVHVVETVDLVQDENMHWCEVMEFCPGGDLYAAIKRGSMHAGEAECYFKQLVRGVAYLHSMGVAHRDIKPENLLLDAKGRVKITDFGVSDVFRMCWETAVHYSTGLCGSEPYIAPEQFERREYDARLVDVWAVGVVYYCLRMGELPWRVAKMSDPSFAHFVGFYHASRTPAPLVNLLPPSRLRSGLADADHRPRASSESKTPSRATAALVKKMLCPDPALRIGISEIGNDPWFASIQACGETLAKGHHDHSIVLTVATST